MRTFALIPVALGQSPSQIATSPIDLYTSKGFTLSSPRELTANYSFSVDVASSAVWISIHTVSPFLYVKLTDTMIIVSPSVGFSNQSQVDALGNEYLTVTLQPPYSQSHYSLTILQHFTAYAIDYSIDPTKIGGYDKNSSMYQLYTQAAQYIESDNPEIIAKAKEIVGGETNPYRIAFKIHTFVVNHMTYDMAAVTPWKPETEGALYALHSGRGVCRHYSALFTALARAAGIPTADIWGSDVSHGGDDGSSKHSWAQFYLPNYGWVPTDPTMNQFAQLSNVHVPIMSVEYTYRRSWALGEWQSNISGEDPVITQGYQLPEFNWPSTIVFLVLVVSLYLLRKRRRDFASDGASRTISALINP